MAETKESELRSSGRELLSRRNCGNRYRLVWIALRVSHAGPGACWLKERTGSFAKTVDELIFYAHSSGQRHILAFVLFREGWR